MSKNKPPQEVGMIGEAAALFLMVSSGIHVYQPFGNIFRYDFVIDRGRGFERVQVKTGKLRRGVILFKASSVKKVDGVWRLRPYTGEIELFAVYCAETGGLYLVPVGDVNETEATLRIAPAKNNQATNIRWASDYLVGSFKPT